jgi:histidine phosphotransfer protein HptB
MSMQSDSQVLDREQLRNITLDDEELMREIVSALVAEVSVQINALDEAIRSSRVQDCVKLAHSARGACGNVGAASLAALFSAVESEAKNGDLASCLPKIEALSMELEKLRGEVSTI